MEGKEVGEG